MNEFGTDRTERHRITGSVCKIKMEELGAKLEEKQKVQNVLVLNWKKGKRSKYHWEKSQRTPRRHESKHSNEHEGTIKSTCTFIAAYFIVPSTLIKSNSSRVASNAIQPRPLAARSRVTHDNRWTTRGACSSAMAWHRLPSFARGHPNTQRMFGATVDACDRGSTSHLVQTDFGMRKIKFGWTQGAQSWAVELEASVLS